jgi:small subunit ribosomal protein S11
MLKHEHMPTLPHGMGRLVIHAGRNNTIMTLTDWRYQVLKICSGGLCGLKGAHRGTSEAGVRVATNITDEAKSRGFREMVVVLKGFGPGRDSAFRTVVASGLLVRKIEDATPIRHGGTRPRKMRRV